MHRVGVLVRVLGGACACLGEGYPFGCMIWQGDEWCIWLADTPHLGEGIFVICSILIILLLHRLETILSTTPHPIDS